jgi:predicted Rossmann fold flavoprotein
LREWKQKSSIRAQDANMRVERHEAVVVGAGASGLWAAARLAEAGVEVLVLEKTARCGTKILASGGTHCNLTTTLDAQAAGALFGKVGARFLRHGLRVLPPRAVRERFHDLGVQTQEAPLEKVFPSSGRARDVRDALSGWMLSAGAQLRLECGVRSVERHAEGWLIAAERGPTIVTQALVLALGGRSYARTGTTGDAYAWLAALNLPLVEPVPALVPLTSPAAWVRELSGIAVQSAHARMLDATGLLLGERTRPVLFTHQGISGPGAMDLSEHVARRGGAARILSIDLAHGLSEEALQQRLTRSTQESGAASVARVLSQEWQLELPRRLLEAVLAQAGLAPDARMAQLARDKRQRLVAALQGLAVPVDDTRGFDWAEVTAGGLALAAVDPGSLEVKGHSGLHVIGELLDLQGPIGGLNFQAAFATAELAASALVKRLRKA